MKKKGFWTPKIQLAESKLESYTAASLGYLSRKRISDSENRTKSLEVRYQNHGEAGLHPNHPTSNICPVRFQTTDTCVPSMFHIFKQICL